MQIRRSGQLSYGPNEVLYLDPRIKVARLGNDPVDNVIFNRLLRSQVLLDAGQSLNLFDRHSGLLTKDLVQGVLQAPSLFDVGLHLGQAAGRRSPKLMRHDPGVRRDKPLASGPAHQQHGTTAHRLADTDGGDGTTEESEGVVNREEAVDVTAVGVDVEQNVFGDVLTLQLEQLLDDIFRLIFVELASQVNDPTLVLRSVSAVEVVFRVPVHAKLYR